MADRCGALDEQVAHLETSVDFRAPDGTNITFRCFLTGNQTFLKTKSSFPSHTSLELSSQQLETIFLSRCYPSSFHFFYPLLIHFEN